MLTPMDSKGKGGPAAPFALRLFATAGPSSLPARLATDTPDGRVVPEHGTAA